MLGATGLVLAKIASSSELPAGAPPIWAGPVGIAAAACASVIVAFAVLNSFHRDRLLVRCR
jgi:hypothetical protein